MKKMSSTMKSVPDNLIGDVFDGFGKGFGKSFSKIKTKVGSSATPISLTSAYQSANQLAMNALSILSPS